MCTIKLHDVVFEQNVVCHPMVARLPVYQTQVEGDLVLQVEAVLANLIDHVGRRTALHGVLVHVNRKVVETNLLEGSSDVVQ